MKKLLLLSSMTILALFTKAQNVAVNTDGTTAHTSSIFDAKSSNKGLLIPRMTSVQRAAILAPALGLLVFDTDTKTIWAFNGIVWSNLTSAGGGSLTLPFDQTVNTAGTAFKVSNSGTAIEGNSSAASTSGVLGTTSANGSNGVFGFSTSTNGVGVRGEASGTGTGVLGYSTNGTGMSASSIAGTGLYANSTSGLALNVNGNLKITGGNTNPSNGAVLTSDANGNAVWKSNRIAFSVSGVNYNLSNLSNFPANTLTVVHLTTKEFDYGINYNINTDGSPTFGEDMFVAPKTGLYHFNAALGLTDDQQAEIKSVWLKIKILRVVNGSAVIIYGASSEFLKVARADWVAQATISKDIKLVAGDIVNLELDNTGANSSMVRINNIAGISHFGCHLLFED